MGMFSEIKDMQSREMMLHFGKVINKGGGQAFPCEATYKKEKAYIGGLTRIEYFAEGVASSLAAKLIESCIDEDGEIDEYKWARVSEQIVESSYTLGEKMARKGNDLD